MLIFFIYCSFVVCFIIFLVIFQNMCKIAAVLAIFVGACYTNELSKNESDSLRLVHVFLRHGARTPEFKDRYPNDPYTAEKFQPEGYGQLTNYGKEMAFTLGKVLRKRYSYFLGDIYTPDIVQAKSTDFDRTKMSVLLALAGLFPPAPSQKWSNDLDWLPIPYDFDKDKYDFTLKRPNTYCPAYMRELNNQLQSEKTLSFLKHRKGLFKYLEENTGKPMNTLQDGFGIYQTLTAEKTMNLTLPEWTKDVFPEKITELALKQVELENANSILRKFNGGRSLQKVIKHMVEKTEGTHQPQGRKIYLYSGHENNVINILAAMNVFKQHFPNYSSAVLIELHYLYRKQIYGVKVLYVEDINKDPVELEIPGCTEFCPLSRFIQLTKEHVPKNYTRECESLINLD